MTNLPVVAILGLALFAYSSVAAAQDDLSEESTSSDVGSTTVSPPAKAPRPYVLDYDPSRPIPKGYGLEEYPRKGLLVGGGIVLGLGYAVGLLEVQQDHHVPEDATMDSDWLLIPVLGPWIAMTTIHPCSYKSDPSTDFYHYCASSSDTAKGLALVGGIQAIGLGMWAAAFIFPSKQLVRIPLVVRPVSLGPGVQGLAVSGRY